MIDLPRAARSTAPESNLPVSLPRTATVFEAADDLVEEPMTLGPQRVVEPVRQMSRSIDQRTTPEANATSLPRAAVDLQTRLAWAASATAAVSSPAADPQRGAEVDELPTPVHNPAPAYPPAALRRRAAGRVVLAVRVGVSGQASDVSIHHSSGAADLDEAARVAVQSWRFRPAHTAGVPVEQVVAVPVWFVLPR